MKRPSTCDPRRRYVFYLSILPWCLEHLECGLQPSPPGCFTKKLSEARGNGIGFVAAGEAAPPSLPNSPFSSSSGFAGLLVPPQHASAAGPERRGVVATWLAVIVLACASRGGRWLAVRYSLFLPKQV